MREVDAQTCTADSAADTWRGHACTYMHTHTLLVKHLNHISCLPDIHHSHRQRHMPERGGNCMATCTTTYKQTRARPLSRRRHNAGEGKHNSPPSCIHLSAHISRTGYTGWARALSRMCTGIRGNPRSAISQREKAAIACLL